MRKHISAYTEAGPSVPAYMSVNKEDTGENKFTITVRSRGGQQSGTIVLTAEILEVIACEILDFLHKD